MKMISIVCVIDVVGALANNTLSENIYLVDNNKINGSTQEGTEFLKTMVQEGDDIVWVIQPLECEAHASIENVLIDNDYCTPEKKYYQGTDVCYWTGKIKKGINIDEIPYSLQLKVGSRVDLMASNSTPKLVLKKTA